MFLSSFEVMNFISGFPSIDVFCVAAVRVHTYVETHMHGGTIVLSLEVFL